MKATFGEYIKQLRADNGLTLTQLAFQLDLDFEKLKTEYFGDQFAKKMYAYNCSTETLIVAEEKVNYLKSKNVKQTEIKF